MERSYDYWVKDKVICSSEHILREVKNSKLQPGGGIALNLKGQRNMPLVTLEARHQY